MTNKAKVRIYIAAVGTLAAVAMTVAWLDRSAFPGYWGFGIFATVSFFLSVTKVKLRSGDGSGSVAFIAENAAGILFGGFWSGLIVIVSTTASQVVRRPPLERVLFNVFQKVLSLTAAMIVYRSLGGPVPPNYLIGQPAVEPAGVLAYLLAFFAGAITYMMVNTIAVSGVVALSTGKRIWDVWKTNTLWFLGYDVLLTSTSLLVAFLYLSAAAQSGMARFWFVLILAMAVAIRHVYGKLATLQNLYAELDATHERLELNLREQLAVMVRAIEARDPYTSGHSRRVAILSRTIAVDLGLPSDLVEEVANAALLHDVGKIHAEFAPLLQKEGRLTEDEWELMKTHSVRGFELVSMFSRFHGTVDQAVLHHHERWDGKGYPAGLAGDAIPIGSRIIMISDTIDAMTSDRPYRKALPFEAVVAELLKYRGTQFTPDLVDLAVRSVSVRRLVADPNMMAEYKEVKGKRAAPLRSQSSFWEGLLADNSAR